MQFFSRRTDWPLAANRLHALAAARRAAGGLLDLTETNPTVCGFTYPRQALLAALGQAAALRYDPQPQGLLVAREAIGRYYAERTPPLEVPPERLLLTASTSEAYSHLFRLLCDAGDGVWMPTPSYPLFEMLAGISDVSLVASPMLYDDGWQLDLSALAQGEADRMRAILLVHPNNPTGSYIKAAEWQAVQELAAARGWAVIVDEVFFDYALGQPQRLEFDACAALTFLLNGFSKIAGLPQMKLGWISIHGPTELRKAAMARLEVINDMYLSVDAPIQHAAAAVLGTRHEMQGQIRTRLRENLAVVDQSLERHPAVERLPVEGGWSLALRLPRIHSDEEWAEMLVERAGVLTHPGHFYGFSDEAHLVLSLLTPTATLAAGLEALLSLVEAEAP